MRIIQQFLNSFICLLAIFSAAAFAQSNYPSKPINFIVPYGAGGSADSRSRQLAQKMSLILKQPIVIDNKPGAGGNIGTEAIVRSAPDGYTIGMGNFAPMAVNKTLFGNLRYDPETDLTPIILIEKGPLVLVVNPNSPFKTVQDIVQAAKAKPGVLTFSSGGIGGSHQLSAELFELNAGIQMIHVPYKSGSAALTDLMAGNVDLMFDQMYSAVPSIKADKIRPLAITSKKRSPLLPNVPSFVELGYPKVEVLNWQGLIAPKGTPKAAVEKVQNAYLKVMKDKAYTGKMAEQAIQMLPPEQYTGEALSKHTESEVVRWRAVAARSGLSLD